MDQFLENSRIIHKKHLLYLLGIMLIFEKQSGMGKLPEFIKDNHWTSNAQIVLLVIDIALLMRGLLATELRNVRAITS